MKRLSCILASAALFSFAVFSFVSCENDSTDPPPVETDDLGSVVNGTYTVKMTYPSGEETETIYKSRLELTRTSNLLATMSLTGLQVEGQDFGTLVVSNVMLGGELEDVSLSFVGPPTRADILYVRMDGKVSAPADGSKTMNAKMFLNIDGKDVEFTIVTSDEEPEKFTVDTRTVNFEADDDKVVTVTVYPADAKYSYECDEQWVVLKEGNADNVFTISAVEFDEYLAIDKGYEDRNTTVFVVETKTGERHPITVTQAPPEYVDYEIYIDEEYLVPGGGGVGLFSVEFEPRTNLTKDIPFRTNSTDVEVKIEIGESFVHAEVIDNKILRITVDELLTVVTTPDARLGFLHLKASKARENAGLNVVQRYGYKVRIEKQILGTWNYTCKYLRANFYGDDTPSIMEDSGQVEITHLFDETVNEYAWYGWYLISGFKGLYDDSDGFIIVKNWEYYTEPHEHFEFYVQSFTGNDEMDYLDYSKEFSVPSPDMFKPIYGDYINLEANGFRTYIERFQWMPHLYTTNGATRLDMDYTGDARTYTFPYETSGNPYIYATKSVINLAGDPDESWEEEIAYIFDLKMNKAE